MDCVKGFVLVAISLTSEQPYFGRRHKILWSGSGHYARRLTLFFLLERVPI
jgi:hypothetical protein